MLSITIRLLKLRLNVIKTLRVLLLDTQPRVPRDVIRDLDSGKGPTKVGEIFCRDKDGGTNPDKDHKNS